MKLLDSIKSFINKTDLRTFYTYVIGYIATCVVLVILMVVYYYRSTNALQKKIKNINATREEVLEILEKFALIKQQQTIVEEILAKDPDFKIAGYFEKLLIQLNLKDKEDPREEINTTDLEDNYRKTELVARFEGITMQDLTRLLEEIEKNPRVATERLEITKSKKPRTIEVGLAISTLLPKIESTST